MSASDGQNDAGELAPRGRRKKSSFFLLLATGLLIFAAVVGAAFVILRPTTLRIAVGPSGGDDVQLVQGLAQNFASEGGSVRLSIVATAGPVDSIAALSAGRADLAVARADEDIPDGVGAVAIMRKNLVVLWAPTGPAKKAQHKNARSNVGAAELPSLTCFQLQALSLQSVRGLQGLCVRKFNQGE